MKERPIIFSAPMVRAILAGTKTQTRRVVKLKPWQQIEERDDGAPWPWMYDDDRAGDHWLPCPYGQPGDRLWVREAWAPGDWLVFGSAKDDPETVLYRADQAALHWDGEAMRTPMDTYAFPWDAVRWKPSIHMPRWASRITLELTSVRVERLQDITEADAIAEGVTPKWEPGCSGRLMEAIGGFSFRPAASAYADLWESLHGPGSWDANPWVWVVEFGRIQPAEAA
jgi:hypothetical protein